MKRFLKTLLISSIIGTFIFLYLFFGETNKNLALFSYLLIGLNITGFATLFINKKVAHFSKFRSKPGVRLLVGIFTNYCIGLLIFGNYSLIADQIFPEQSFWFFEEAQKDLTIKFFIISFVFVLFYALIDFIISSYSDFSEQQLSSAQNEREQTEALLEALKSQLSPHYLYNNLNTISLLTYQENGQAEKYIRELASTYKYIFDIEEKNFVTLGEERNFAEAYIYLLSIRFEDRLQVNMEIPDYKTNFYLPPLSLQILIENAIKHNAPSKKEQLVIDITTDNSYVCVTNNFLETKDKNESFKIGLKNLKRRYSLFTENKVEIYSGKKFTVKLPLIHQPKQIA